MAALDFPNAPTNGQQWVGTNGATYTWDGLTWNVSSVPGTSVAPIAPTAPVQGQLWWRNDPDGNLFISYNDGNSTQWVPAVPSSAPQWTVTGGALTPVDATKGIALPGGANNPVVFGSRTVKGRLISNGISDNVSVGANIALNAGSTAWVQDDAAKASWAANLSVASDNFTLSRFAPGGVGANLLTFDSIGNLIISPPGSGLAAFLGYGYGSSIPFRGLAANGSASAPTPLNQYGQLVKVEGAGCYQAGNNYTVQASLMFFAQEAWTATARGTSAQLAVTPAGTTTLGGKTFNFDSDGSLRIDGPTGQKSTGTTWSNPSDIRLKKNITDYAAGLSEILRLRPVQFEHNGFADTVEGTKCWGYLADDVAAVLPECVSKHTKKLANDEEVELDLLDTSNISLAVVNAIKELAGRVAALEAK